MGLKHGLSLSGKTADSEFWDRYAGETRVKESVIRAVTIYTLELILLG
jgi:hypothetical protein